MATHTVRLNDDLTALIAEEATRQRKETGINVTKSDIIKEALENYFDSSRLKRINDSIDRMQAEYGSLFTWRGARGCIALDLPRELVVLVEHQEGVGRDIALEKLTGLMVPQLERLTPEMLQTALGDEYQGNRSDYVRLVALACSDLTYSPSSGS